MQPNETIAVIAQDDAVPVSEYVRKILAIYFGASD